MSLRALQATTDTGERPTDAQPRRQRRQAKPREGVSIYLPTVEAAEAVRTLLEFELDGGTLTEGSEIERRYAAAAAAITAALERRRKRGASRARSRAA